MSDLLSELNLGMSALVNGVRQALVHIGNGRGSAGAGTIWHSDGLILTNAHVLQSRHPTITLWDGRQFEAQVLAQDRQRDLAALAIHAADLPAVAPGNSRALRPGEWVLALGHPWGVTGAVSAGAVIAVGRPLESVRYPGELIQTSLWLRPGHSGGPLIDGHGRVVGINTMISGPQVGLAVPVHVVKEFLRERLRKPVQVV